MSGAGRVALDEHTANMKREVDALDANKSHSTCEDTLTYTTRGRESEAGGRR